MIVFLLQATANFEIIIKLLVTYINQILVSVHFRTQLRYLAPSVALETHFPCYMQNNMCLLLCYFSPIFPQETGVLFYLLEIPIQLQIVHGILRCG